MSDWQPIETAPDDGTFVLCLHASGHVNILQFCQDSYWRGDVDDTVNWHPTHWMPVVRGAAVNGSLIIQDSVEGE